MADSTPEANEIPKVSLNFTEAKYDQIAADSRRISRAIINAEGVFIPSIEEADHIYAAKLPNTNIVVGLVDLRKHRGDAAEISVRVDPNYQKQGIAGEMVRQTLLHVRVDIPDIKIIRATVIPNSAAEKVFQKAGFIEDAERQQEIGRNRYKLTIA